MLSGEQHKQPSSVGGRQVFRRGALHVAFSAFLWWLLTEGNLSSWEVGVPVIVAATIVSLTLFPSPRWRWRFSSFVRFLPFFLWQSLRGGVDVARRAFHPGLPLAPLFLNYRLRLPEGPAQVFLADLVSLLPGTLSADLQQGYLTVHALDGDPLVLTQELQSLENRTAELYCVTLSAPQA